MFKATLLFAALGIASLAACDPPRQATPVGAPSEAPSPPEASSPQPPGPSTASPDKPGTSPTTEAPVAVAPTLRRVAEPDEVMPQPEAILIESSSPLARERVLLDIQEKTRMQTKIVAGEDSKEGVTESEVFKTLLIVIEEVSGDQITRARFVYEDVKERQKDGEALDRFKSPVSNKTYVLALTDAGLKVTYKGGGAPSKDEIDAVSRDADVLTLSRRFLAILPRRPLKPGEVIEVDKDALRAFIFPKGTIVLEIKEPTLTFKDLRKVDGLDAAVFDLSLNAVLQEGQMTISATVRGEVALEVAGARVLRTSWQGPIVLTGTTNDGDAKIKVAGSGESLQTQRVIPQTPEEPLAQPTP